MLGFWDSMASISAVKKKICEVFIVLPLQRCFPTFPQCDVGTGGLELLGKLGLTGFFIVFIVFYSSASGEGRSWWGQCGFVASVGSVWGECRNG